jgi:UDP-2,3-diacylglucosamine pyrophosphatase LpxH
MLVIVSDLHLTDGTCGPTTSSGALQIFAERLRELAEAASWRPNGRYQPISHFDVLLLGDILDPIRSAQWLARPMIRPWQNPHDAEFVDLFSKITTDILEHNESGLACLRGLNGEPGLTVPAALRSGRVNPDGQRQSVAVRLHYMVGNHDWPYHLPGAKYSALRKKIVQQMGLANDAHEPFPHDAAESDTLISVMRRHKVTARHGDQFDPINFGGDRDLSSLGDCIVIDLLNRFAIEVARELSEDLSAATILGLREIDNVRPSLLVPVWIDGLLERTCEFPSLRKRVKAVWDRLAGEFLEIDFVRRYDARNPFDLVSGLQKTLLFSKRPPSGWASSIVTWANKIRGVESGSYHHHAVAEPDFRSRRSKYVVYGHTHFAESVPLDASYASGCVLNQEYFNSGTWRRVHRQTCLGPDQHEFVPRDVMTCTVFFHGDERKGRPYETWTGSLGCRPVDLSVHRIDEGKPKHAPHQPVSAPTLHRHTSHFANPSVDAPAVNLQQLD